MPPTTSTSHIDIGTCPEKGRAPGAQMRVTEILADTLTTREAHDASRRQFLRTGGLTIALGRPPRRLRVGRHRVNPLEAPSSWLARAPRSARVGISCSHAPESLCRRG